MFEGVSTHFIYDLEKTGHQEWADRQEKVCYVPAHHQRSYAYVPVPRTHKCIPLIACIAPMLVSAFMSALFLLNVFGTFLTGGARLAVPSKKSERTRLCSYSECENRRCVSQMAPSQPLSGRHRAAGAGITRIILPTKHRLAFFFPCQGFQNVFFVGLRTTCCESGNSAESSVE
jgi:hypothetical protein